MNFAKLVVLVVVVSIASSSATLMLYENLKKQTNEDMIKDFYLVENAVHVSPHSVRNSMDNGENKYLLVDLRSQEEYEKEHVIGAISIPAYKDKDTSAYGDVDRIVGEFSSLPKDREIVVYCYSMPCMTGRKVGKMLVEHGIYVKHLEIGWNEWRYFWNLWNHEHEWNETDINDYIWKGKDPGIPKIKANSTSCPVQGELSC